MPVISKTPSSLTAPKRFFTARDDTMRVVLLALEVQDRVDDVLERLRAGEVAVLGDMADEERRDVLALGGKEKLGRRLAYLTDTPGRRLELEREHRLNGVDDDATPA